MLKVQLTQKIKAIAKLFGMWFLNIIAISLPNLVTNIKKIPQPTFGTIIKCIGLWFLNIISAGIPKLIKDIKLELNR